MTQLFLIGFMAAGKTSVGRAIASASRRKFVDLDDRIAALGEPVAQLVARDQAEFRRREAATLQMLIADREPLVIATVAARGIRLQPGGRPGEASCSRWGRVA